MFPEKTCGNHYFSLMSWLQVFKSLYFDKLYRYHIYQVHYIELFNMYCISNVTLYYWKIFFSFDVSWVHYYVK